jgi:hypothetical protein
MFSLSARDLLNVWEWGQAQPPAQRALLLLAAARPGTTPDLWAELSVGRRDACLLALREQVFGPHLAGLATCPACSQRLEFSLCTADLWPGDRAIVEDSGEGAHSLAIASHEVHFRLPNSLDLATIAGCADLGAARQSLLERCLLSARQDGRDLDPAELPDQVVAAVVGFMAQADPAADVRLDLSCPSCDHHWQAPFDIVSFFWSEIHTWAQRVLRDVHILASAYGWSEADILAISPSRRHSYMQMIGG